MGKSWLSECVYFGYMHKIKKKIAKLISVLKVCKKVVDRKAGGQRWRDRKMQRDNKRAFRKNPVSRQDSNTPLDLHFLMASFSY